MVRDNIYQVRDNIYQVRDNIYQVRDNIYQVLHVGVVTVQEVDEAANEPLFLGEVFRVLAVLGLVVLVLHQH